MDTVEMRAKWKAYEARLKEPDGEGSLFGASFIIARSGVSDVTELLDELDRLTEIETKARGLVRTHGKSRNDEILVVRQWWDGLCKALEERGEVTT